MPLRATGRLLYQRLSMGVSRNFSAKAAVSPENVQKKLLNELHKKRKLEEIRSLTASAEKDIAYWEPRTAKKKTRYLNQFTCMALSVIYVVGDYIYREKTGGKRMLRG